MILSKKEQEDFLIKIIEKAMESPVFKENLVHDSLKAIYAEFGKSLEIREGYNINFEPQAGITERIFEEHEKELIIFIPDTRFETSDELLEEELDMVVGGGGQSSLENILKSPKIEREGLVNKIRKWWT